MVEIQDVSHHKNTIHNSKNLILKTITESCQEEDNDDNEHEEDHTSNDFSINAVFANSYLSHHQSLQRIPIDDSEFFVQRLHLKVCCLRI